MTTIIDPELTVRLGSLDAVESERIQDYATAAFLWRGMRQSDAVDVARALHWRAVGRDLRARAEEVIGVLALQTLTPAEHSQLATLLDVQCPADHGAPCSQTPDARRLAPADYARLGRRIAHALALLDTVERATT